MDKRERLQLANSTVKSFLVACACMEILKDRTKNTELAEYVEKAQKSLAAAFADVVDVFRLHGYCLQFDGGTEIILKLE